MDHGRKNGFEENESESEEEGQSQNDNVNIEGSGEEETLQDSSADDQLNFMNDNEHDDFNNDEFLQRFVDPDYFEN